VHYILYFQELVMIIERGFKLSIRADDHITQDDFWSYHITC